jgi:thioredoxin reductase (NADPH)
MTNPAILTVDDDPAVSRAVARDIRRQYGDRYRVVRASSGQDALEALREIKLRGEQVALMLADYRMPQMNGIQFLETAMDLFPLARRVLLTAYADTDAAIDAINLVDLDHYLLKPWNPPEEKLYPVVDVLLEAWQATPDTPAAEIRVIGHRWSAPSYKVREFLARNLVPYRWVLADEPEGEQLLNAAGLTPADVPVVVTGDGQTLVKPSAEDLATHVGLTTTPAADFYDLVVIGAGPAGLGAAVYGASEGLRTVLVERRATGGQAGQSSRIENYLGFPDGVSGSQLTERARRQALKFGAELLSAREVVGLEAAGSTRLLHRRVLPAADRPGPDRADRPRRVLRLGVDRGAELLGRGDLHRRRGQLSRPGRHVFLPLRPAGAHPHPRWRPDPVDVAVPDRPDRADRQHRGAPAHRGGQRRGGRASGAADPV